MKEKIDFPIKNKLCILSLGAESVGRFSVYDNGKDFISENFGDILEEKNLGKFKKAVLACVKKRKPDIILTDLHPLYNSTILGEELSRKFKIPIIKVQHHLAHIFSAVGDCILNTKYSILNTFCGIAADGTGFGFDGNIWGGEIFKFKVQSSKFKVNNTKQNLTIERVGSLEEQTMIGGDLAVKEPARMLIGALNKFLPKEKVYESVKKYYTKNEFELLYNQLQQNFNCQKTTSTGRILDAVSILLGFAENKRNFKHEATRLLEENSTLPYKNYELRIKNYELRKILNTTYLFEYLLKNINKDKKRLAATAQEYIARGFYEIIKAGKNQISDVPDSKLKNIQNTKYCIPDTYFAGGMANNKIMSSYLENKNVYISKKIPCGDEGIAFGQIVYYLGNNA
jgi:hydrogenase maturation protein HypF